MSYEFIEPSEYSCAEIARAQCSLLLGRVAVCTSFDSGRFIEPRWRQLNGYSVSPPIDEQFISNWPISHDDFYDEWWIFDAAVPSDFKVEAFCNYGERIADYRLLDDESFCPLDKYLDKFQPVLIFGNNEYSYLIRRIKSE